MCYSGKRLIPEQPWVVISHPHRQHVHETVIAAQKAGVLESFITALYPTSRWKRMGRKMAARGRGEIDSGRVRLIPWFQLIDYLLSGAAQRFLHLSQHRLQSWANNQFDRAAGRHLRRRRSARLVHGFEASALHTFEAAKQRGLVTVLDVPSANELLVRAASEEAERAGFGRRPSTSSWSHELRRERALADYLFAPSTFVRDCLIANGAPPERIVLLPYGADPTIFAPRAADADDGVFRVLFVGRVGLAKGIRYLLEAFKCLALPDAELLLVGKPTTDGERILREYRGHYRLIGAVPHSRLGEWYGQASVFAFPSLAEGSALVVYEAMASGLPVIVTPESGSIARDGLDGLVVPSGRTDALAAALSRLHDHAPERMLMGASGRRRIVEHYTWQHYHQRLAAAYRAIIEKAPVQAAVDGATC